MSDTANEMNENLEDADNKDSDEEKVTAEVFREQLENRAKDREEEEASDAAELKKFKKHVDKDGNFRSLKDQMLYFYDDLPADLGPGSPDPADYSPDQLKKFEADLIAFHQTGGTKLDGGLDAAADDPHRSKRKELMHEYKEWEEKEVSAKESGNADDVDRARYFKKDIAKQIRALPEPPAIKHVRDLVNHQREFSLGLSHDDEASEADWWNDERMKHDSAVLAAEHISEGDSNTIYLPAEKSNFGDVKEFTPKNVLKFDSLPGSVVQQIRQNVKNDNAKQPDEVFHIAWRTLHRLGYAEQGKPGPAASAQKKPKKKKSPLSGYHKNMSQAEFTRWRESQGARRF